MFDTVMRGADPPASQGPAAAAAAPEDDPAPARWQEALRPVREAFPPPISTDDIQTGLIVWSALFGVISFELFGQFHNVVGENPGDREAFFSECITRWALQLGLPQQAAT